jgi:hypothetical protein
MDVTLYDGFGSFMVQLRETLKNPTKVCFAIHAKRLHFAVKIALNFFFHLLEATLSWFVDR